jgi:hypothetical protein
MKHRTKKAAMKRGGLVGLGKEMLLPLPSGSVRALSLENHVAFAAVRTGRGGSEQIVHLVRVLYLAFFLRDEMAVGADLGLYRQVEAALDACIERGDRGESWLLLDREQAAVVRLLAVHDEQLATMTNHSYKVALDRLKRFRIGTGSSPISMDKDGSS